MSDSSISDDKSRRLVDGISMELIENPHFLELMRVRIPVVTMLVQGHLEANLNAEESVAPVLQSLLNLDGMNGLFETLDCKWMIRRIRELKILLKKKRIPMEKREIDGVTHLYLPSRDTELALFTKSRDKDLFELSISFQDNLERFRRILNIKLRDTIMDGSNLAFALSCTFVLKKNNQPIQTKALRKALEEINFSLGLPLNDNFRGEHLRIVRRAPASRELTD